MIKRIFDLVCALPLLIVSFLPLVLIALFIKASSKGPAIFQQIRIGYKQRPFTIYKLRTMKDGEHDPHEEVTHGDTRVTPIGKFLRRMYIDELPQLWNVVRGDMSLVGPRPYPCEMTERRIKEIPHYADRFTVRPGLTGIVQLAGRKLSMERGPRNNFRFDMLYVKNQSFFLDMKIIIKTIALIWKRYGV